MHLVEFAMLCRVRCKLQLLSRPHVVNESEQKLLRREAVPTCSLQLLRIGSLNRQGTENSASFFSF